MISTIRTYTVALLTFAYPLAIDSARCDAADKKKPNFVIIFTDDQGYGDLSCYGADHVGTPRIDQMAKEGARLTSFYVAAPVCTPSRAALMTGCYPKRCLLYTSPSPRDQRGSRMPSSA